MVAEILGPLSQDDVRALGTRNQSDKHRCRDRRRKARPFEFGHGAQRGKPEAYLLSVYGTTHGWPRGLAVAYEDRRRVWS